MPPPLDRAGPLGISYRTMTDADLPFTAALYTSTRAEEMAANGWPPELQATFLKQQHEAQHRHYSCHFADAEWLIIERSGEAIGRLYLDETPASFHIVDISLLPHCRGAGIGSTILADLLDHARTNGKTVGINVAKDNPARRLYDRMGFRFMADQGVYDLMEAH